MSVAGGGQRCAGTTTELLGCQGSTGACPSDRGRLLRLEEGPAHGLGRAVQASVSLSLEPGPENELRRSPSSSSVSSRSTAAEARPTWRFSWLNDPRVAWRHPAARIFVAVLILVLDMFLFLEDPVNDSHIEAHLPGVGHCWSFVFQWPSSPGLIVLRTVMLPAALLAGCWFGRQVLHHKFLRDYCGLEMFSDCNGTLLTMGIGCAGAVFASSMVYNLLVGKEELSGSMGMNMSEFARMAQCCSLSADILTILMILDAALQDKTHYPEWLPGFKHIWTDACGGYVRVFATWILAATCFTLILTMLFSVRIGDLYNCTAIGGVSEVDRATLMSFIIFGDLFSVAQDWDFPSFQTPLQVDGKQVLIAGTFLPELRYEFLARIVQRLPPAPIPESLRRCLPGLAFFSFTVSGAWLTYGPLFVVMGLDLFCTKNQLLYEPQSYGQYVQVGDGGGPGERIWTIRDEAYLAGAYDGGVLVRPARVTYAARWNASTGEAVGQGPGAQADLLLQSRHTESPLRYACALPGLFLIPLFFAVVAIANRRKIGIRTEREQEQEQEQDSASSALSDDL